MCEKVYIIGSNQQLFERMKNFGTTQTDRFRFERIAKILQNPNVEITGNDLRIWECSVDATRQWLGALLLEYDALVSEIGQFIRAGEAKPDKSETTL